MGILTTSEFASCTCYTDEVLNKMGNPEKKSMANDKFDPHTVWAEYPILDKGKLRLIDYMGGDHRVVAAARVLVDPPWRDEDDPKLIKYMIKHRHTSPFEHVMFTFFVKAPITVFRQWMRHRTWKFNEVSGRYMELTEHYVPSPETIGVQSKKNHQARIMTEEPNHAASNFLATWQEQSFEHYRVALDELKIPRELARGGLPVHTYSQMYGTIDLHNLFGLFSLRIDDHAQWEIRQYAEKMLDIAECIAPLSVAAWKEYVFNTKRVKNRHLKRMLEILATEELEGDDKRMFDELSAEYADLMKE